MRLLLLTSAITCLSLSDPAAAVTEAKSKKPLPQTVTSQILPSETQKAGRDIELRKVQAMLSGQKPKKVVKAEPRP